MRWGEFGMPRKFREISLLGGQQRNARAGRAVIFCGDRLECLPGPAGERATDATLLVGYWQRGGRPKSTLHVEGRESLKMIKNMVAERNCTGQDRTKCCMWNRSRMRVRIGHRCRDDQAKNAGPLHGEPTAMHMHCLMTSVAWTSSVISLAGIEIAP